jgi:ATP-binding cassette subfamily B protein
MAQTKAKGNYRTILRYVSGSWRFYLLALTASMLATVFNFLSPQIIRFTVDSVIGEEPDKLSGFMLNFYQAVGGREGLRSNLIFCAVAVVAVAALSGLCNLTSRISTAKASEGFVRRLRNALYAHIQKLPYQWHMENQTGDIIQRCTSDVETMRSFVTNQILEICRVVFLLIFAVSMMFPMNAMMTWAAIAFIPIVALYSGYFHKKISKKFREADEAEGVLSAAVQENLTGVRVVRAFGREKYEIERFDEKNNLFSELWVKLGYVLGAYWGVGDFFTGIQILTILALGTIQTVNGSITLGEFLVFLSYNQTLSWPIRSLGRIISDLSKSGVSAERLSYILNSEEEQDKPGAVEAPMNQDVSFQHVTYRFEGEKAVLDDVTFTIPAGSTFAILGGTGSGKSTLMHLLDRLYDLPEECGKITVGGVNIQDMKRSWIRQNVGMVLQEPFLFSRTIEENIASVLPVQTSTEDRLSQVKQAASIACVDDAIEGFQDGYGTVVGERGVTLSGGQKQRVAIARMLLQKAPIMVFDDSLSAVDAETDSSIRKALHENLGGSTVILISHRITTLMQADTILVLEDGKIAEIGTHDQLLSNNGIYKSIYDIQMNQEDREAAGL